MVKTSKGCFAVVQIKRHFLAMPESFQPKFWLSACHFRRQNEKEPTDRKYLEPGILSH